MAVTAGILVAVWSARADAYQMYRYTDAEGKKIYVQSMDDVPAEFQAGASAVRISEKTGGGEENGGAKPLEKGDAVRAVEQFSLSPSPETGKTRLKGKVKNHLSSRVENVQLHVSVRTSAEVPFPDSAFPVTGVRGAGILEPEESAIVKVELDVAPDSVRGFGYSLSWQAVTAVTPPAPKKEEPDKKIPNP